MNAKNLLLVAVVMFTGCNQIPDTVVGKMVDVRCDTTCVAIVAPLDEDRRVTMPACNGIEAFNLIDKKVFGMRKGTNLDSQCMRFSEYR